MLRNRVIVGAKMQLVVVLNEVLSLNAQESGSHRSYRHQPWSVLNEVLSLNAQEYPWRESNDNHYTLLNEVLSLNAQEFGRIVVPVEIQPSSMKS